jgi:hypothetical protein
MRSEELKQNVTVYGPLFPEPVQIIIAIPMGGSVKLIGKGVRSSTVYEPILSAEQLAQLPWLYIDGEHASIWKSLMVMRDSSCSRGIAAVFQQHFELSMASGQAGLSEK